MNSRLAFRRLPAYAPRLPMKASALLFALLLVASRLGAAPPATNHWAFQPFARAALPAVKNKAWPRTPVDSFILAKMEEQGLKPSVPADKGTLLRRVTFDLHGLPPTPAELDAFLADKSPDAFAKVVDRLLASPRYGERWARHWLDVARFSESDGFEYDKMREHAWHYRDYVIRALNEDKPYARFVTEQIAGDALEPVTRDGVAATGFLVAGPFDEAGNSSASASLKERIREEEMEEMIAAVGQTFLGVTVNCARCHDHKFDPIPQTDYYRLKAALDGVRHGNPREPVAPKDKTNAPIYAVISRQPEATFVLMRGDIEQRRDQVSAGALSAVAGMRGEFGLPADAPEAKRRLHLAEWIVSTDNPLTWRVAVNRVWLHHFGRGLVGTPSDFGVNGERPTHPELLDWLAAEFRDGGGSLKKLHRLILLSAVYQQSGKVISEPVISKSVTGAKAGTGSLVTDSLMTSHPLRRLEAEAVRDAMLAVSGQLNARMGGPGFRPFKITMSNSHFYELIDGGGPEFNRRSLYRAGVQSAKDPLLDSLDCPDPSTKTPARGVTTTPLQALSLMNNAFVQRQARFFAERVKSEAGADAAAQVKLAHRLALGREPRRGELEESSALAQAHGLESVCWALLNASEFLYVR